jgi:hypothetical protein
VSAPVKELERQATKDHPTSRTIKTVHPEKSTAMTPAVHPRVQSQPAIRTQTDQTSAGEYDLSKFDWDKIIEYAHQHFVAIYSVLSKCSYEIDGDKLTLYTVNNFYKRKLDDAKYRVSLSEALTKTGVGSPVVETIGTPPPPKDSTAAAVAAIMGGGEEVNVDA